MNCLTRNEDTAFDHVVVLGAGAIGSFYGALLSRVIDVLIIGMGIHVDEIKVRGLSISGLITGNFHLKASTELRSVSLRTLILLTTKAYDSETAIVGVRHLLSTGTTILVLQNGLGNEGLVRCLVDPKLEVIRGLISSGVEFRKPGEIEVKRLGETVLPRTPAGERIKRLFDSCGLETRLSSQMVAEIWRKLALNCVINPLTAIFRVPNNEIAVDSLANVRRTIVEECIRVALMEGVELSPSLVDEVSWSAASYSNLSSMCQDILAGRKTEIDFINGKVSELGRKHGIETPANDLMTALIGFMEGKRWT